MKLMGLSGLLFWGFFHEASALFSSSKATASVWVCVCVCVCVCVWHVHVVSEEAEEPADTLTGFY